MKTIIYTVGYDSQFKKMCKTGWGCGYILIPLGHRFLRATKEQDEDNWGYIQVPNFSEEITLCEIKEVNGEQYRCLGFDTAHNWNHDGHNFDYVLNKTLEMQRIVDGYES